MKIRLIPMEKRAQVVLAVGKHITCDEAMKFMDEVILRVDVTKTILSREIGHEIISIQVKNETSR